METFLIRALQLIMSLSLLVIIHELGHFLFSKLFKVRVEKFCIFFDPWFTLLKFKPKKSETEYCLGWLPLGGYVKISGMIDESLDTEQMKQPAKEWEFRSKPAWQRLLIMIGGVLFNFILAIIIYGMILFTWGEKTLAPANPEWGMEYSQNMKNAGFEDGDILLASDGKDLTGEMEKFFKPRRGGLYHNADLMRSVANASVVTVLRNGEKTDITMPDDFGQSIMMDSVYFANPIFPCIIDSIMPGGGKEAGLIKGDRITNVNGKEIKTYAAFLDYMNSPELQADSARTATVTYVRDGIKHTAEVKLSDDYKMGVGVKSIFGFLKENTIEYGFLESIPAGITLGVNTLKGYVSDMQYVFTKEGANSLGGFGTIGSIFPGTWDWHRFWEMTAFLSIILAFMNILPIPALDGGHVLFLLYEIIARRKPSDKFMEYAQIGGMVLLFGLLIWANLNDIIRFFF